jgi:hypothetical protein
VLHHMEAMEPGGPRLGGPQREVTGVRRITRLMVVAFSVMVLLGGLLVGWGAVTTPAGASTTIGQTGADASIGCLGGPTSLVQTSTGSGVPGYAVPSGVNEIASWSAQGSFTNSLLALEVWRPTATPGSYELVGVSPPETIENTLNTFTLASPIPVQPGDVLGQLSSALSDYCFVTGSGPAGDVVGSAPAESTSLPIPGTTVAFTNLPYAAELNMAATGIFVSNFQIVTTSLPDATVGLPYSFQLQAVGGTPPYSWNKYPPEGRGVLPRWLRLSTSGLISGTPKKAGTYTVIVKCLQALHPHKMLATQELTLTVEP